MLDQKLVDAQACDNRTIACEAACRWSTSFTQVLKCVGACGRCKAEWDATVKSSAFLFGTSKIVESQIPANETSAIASIRAINEAEMIYASSHPKLGFTADLAMLGGATQTGGEGTIDSNLSSGSKTGYTFTYTPGEEVNGAIRSYTIVAIPNQVGSTGVRSFYSDEAGEIHYSARGPADASSPVMGD